MRRKFSILLLLVLSAPTSLYARSPEESEFYAASLLGDDIARWVMKLNRGPMAIGIFSVYANPPFEADYSQIVETEVVKSLAKAGVEKVSTCPECSTPHVTVSEERLIVKKGAPDLETLKRIGMKQPIDAFMTIDLYRTKLAVMAQVVLYQNPTAVVIAAERFRVPAMSLTDGAVQVLLTFGGGQAIGGTSTTMPLGFGLSLLEEVGFGKAGLSAGAVMGTGSIIYLNPTLAWFGRYGASSLSYSINLGLGFGFAGADKGIVVKGAYEIYLGSLAVAGFDGEYFIPSGTATAGQMNGYFGVHVGFAFGR
ncbi:MAG: hypothetical protein HYR96_07365 [Deltaproteobacteria bacterium]|nr:hypothetical protein [Deltaproteobacteria bacterium]MBI3294201.1 hypothetical protein [Deltaproteobacteria bacterium]